MASQHKRAGLTILGIDPGTARMGFGLIEHRKPTISCLKFGTITTSSGVAKHERLGNIYGKLNRLIETYKPDIFAIEDIFYFKNQKTLVEVSQAKGVAMLAAALSKKECYEFTPLQVKQAVTGYGRADKAQVQIMVQKLLKLNELPKPDDAADALAVAICCAHSLEVLRFISN